MLEPILCIYLPPFYHNLASHQQNKGGPSRGGNSSSSSKLAYTDMVSRSFGMSDRASHVSAQLKTELGGHSKVPPLSPKMHLLVTKCSGIKAKQLSFRQRISYQQHGDRAPDVNTDPYRKSMIHFV